MVKFLKYPKKMGVLLFILTVHLVSCGAGQMNDAAVDAQGEISGDTMTDVLSQDTAPFSDTGAEDSFRPDKDTYTAVKDTYHLNDTYVLPDTMDTSEDTQPPDVAQDGYITDESTADQGKDIASFDTDPYMPGVLVTPITPSIKSNLESILNSGLTQDMNPNVFAKIGDSITKSTSFLRCFAGSDLKLGNYSELQPTITYYNEVTVDAYDNTSFDHDSLCAVGGWSTISAVSGDPSPLEQEIDSIHPTAAIIMYGTNDIGWVSFTTYQDNMEDIVTTLTSHGIIPILSTIPDRLDSADAEAKLPEWNAFIRGLAKEHKVPLMDFWLSLQDLQNKGLAGDGVHPNVYSDDAGVHACYLTPDGLGKGYNVRNLLALQALHKVRTIVIEDGAPDPNPDPACLKDLSCNETCAEDPDCYVCDFDGFCESRCASDPDCGCNCNYNQNVCEPKEDNTLTPCACDPDCSNGYEVCAPDDHCDSWCPANTDPDLGGVCTCNCAYTANVCEPSVKDSTTPCRCDIDCWTCPTNAPCTFDKLPCVEDGHCDSWCPTTPPEDADPDC